jgi:hypothetical protein
MAKLTGPQIGQLQELILDAFSREQFEELLLVKLDIRLNQAIPAGLDWRAAVRAVIVTAGREGWTAAWRVAEARRAAKRQADR